jgi:phenylacetate-CoA ligase
LEKKLLQTLEYVLGNSLFYQRHFSGIDLSNPSLKSFQSLPLTTKQDIAKFNDDFCCIKPENVSEFVSTSGTSGEPITITLSSSDLKRLATNEATSLSKMGFDSSDTFQMLLTLDRQFMAGIAYYSGILKLGASVVRNGPGGIVNQWKSIDKIRPTVLIAVPSFISKLIKYAEENEIDYKNSSVKSIVCIGEPIHNADFSQNILAKRITEKWGVRLCSTYASTEMATAFYQCGKNKGCHNNDDLLFTEILNDFGNPVSHGETGEIVITTLGVEGMPFVRYKTGDIATLHSDNCGCGEVSLRIGPIQGRRDQMVKFRGTTIYPQTIFNALNSISEINQYFVEILQDKITAMEIIIYLSEEEISTVKLTAIKSTLMSLMKVTPSLKLIKSSDIETMSLQQPGRKKSQISFRQMTEF